jgi:ABC-2 type transport system permease protein
VIAATLALLRGHLLEFSRVRAALYWTVAFPLLFLFVFQLAFSQGSVERATWLMPGLFTITLISGSFFGVSIRMVNERENGILRRLRAEPIGPLPVVLAHGLTSIGILALSLLIQGVVGWAVFHFTIAGNPLTLAFVLLLGALSLVPLGLIVGSVARDARSAPPLNNALFFPMIFLSGAAIPFSYLPTWMQHLARVMPTTYLVEALQGVMMRGTGLVRLAAPLAVLVLTAAVGVGLNGMLFRWESAEPVPRGRLWIAVAVMAAVWVGALLFAPALEMARIRP